MQKKKRESSGVTTDMILPSELPRVSTTTSSSTSFTDPARPTHVAAAVGAKMLTTGKFLATGGVAAHLVVVTGVALEDARMATGLHSAVTGLLAPTVLDLVKLGFETDMGDGVRVVLAAQVDSVAHSVVVRIRRQQAPDDAFPEIGLFHEQFCVAENVQALLFGRGKKSSRE